MGENTNISWCDSTFNCWWGCSAVSPGCDHCYAEAIDKRFGGNHWGAKAAPRVMSDAYWKKPHRWNMDALNHGIPHKVFCGSMCDVFDKNAPAGQREKLWELIRQTSMLRWQLLTKRAPNIRRCLPDDWDSGYPNVWLGVTIEDRKHGLPRIDVLREIPANVRFLSIEPLLEDLGHINLKGISWVICGGESGHHARPMEPAWVISIMRQCYEQGVPFFFKQMAKKAPIPNYLRIREYPNDTR